MDLRVCGVDELSGDEAALYLPGKLLGLCDSTLHALGAVGEDDLCAVCFEDISSLNAHRFGHGDDYTVALSCCYGSKTDTGIAGGRLDDDGAGLQLALLLCLFDHSLCDPVLNASCRIEILELSQNCGFEAQIFLDIRYLNERCISDQSEGTFINV